jgi:flavodoxin
MYAVVVYDSKFGNTEKIAEAIARGVATSGTAHVLSIAQTVDNGQPAGERPHLMLIGGPTQRRAATKALRAFVDALPISLLGVPMAAFDTRYRGAKWMMGSAAAEVASVLRAAGAHEVAAPESFYMSRGGPLDRQQLEPGEIERAEQWGREVAAAMATAEGSVA